MSLSGESHQSGFCFGFSPDGLPVCRSLGVDRHFAFFTDTRHGTRLPAPPSVGTGAGRQGHVFDRIGWKNVCGTPMGKG
jgi:hypothetical protein